MMQITQLVSAALNIFILVYMPIFIRLAIEEYILGKKDRHERIESKSRR